MTKTEFIQIGLDLFAELSPDIKKKSETRDYLESLMSELEDQGLSFDDELEDDEEL